MSSFRQLMMRSKGGGSPIPAQYEVVDYIQSSGTQYIDTGLYPNQDYGAVVSFKYIAQGFVFGAELNWANKSFDLIPSPDGVTYVYDGSTSFRYYGTMNTTSLYTCDLKGRVGKLYKDEALIYEYTDPFTRSFTSSYKLVLFALNRGGSIRENGKIKMYACDIYENDVVLRSFVPVFDTINQVYGLYDVVGQQFYGNLGSGNFTGGND